MKKTSQSVLFFIRAKLVILIFLLCFYFLTPAGALADLIWQMPTTGTFEVSYLFDSINGEDEPGPSSWSYPPREIERTLTLQRFDPRLGRLESGFLKYHVSLHRHHETELRGCRWEGISNFFDFAIPGGTPHFTGIEPSTGRQFSSTAPPFPDEVATGYNDAYAGNQLGFRRGGCPTYEGFVDFCIETKDIPDINSFYERSLDTSRFTGVSSLDHRFNMGFSFHGTGSFQWVSDCAEAGPWMRVEASLSGHAEIRAQYVFSPAVDVFVSDAVNHNVHRFRYDGSDAVREEFIAEGSGGLRYPSALAFTPEGDLLIASWPTTFPFESQILRYDRQTGAFRGVFAEHEQLINPMNMVFGPDGDLYVIVQRSPGQFGLPLQLRERVLRFDGQTGEFREIFVAPCGWYATDTCVLDGAWDLAFGPFGDLYVTAREAGVVSRYDGVTGEYKGIFIDGADEVRDIVWPEGSASLFLLEGALVNEYKIDPNTRDAVFWGTATAASPITGAAIAMGPKMRLGTTITTVPSLFSASGAGVFYFSPPRPRTSNIVFSGGVGAATNVVVRPHVLHAISRDVHADDDSWISFDDAGLGIRVRFSEVTEGGTLGLAVSERAPGPDATGFEFLGTYYEFTVHDGLGYAGDVEICLAYNESALPSGTNEADIKVKRWNGTSWDDPITSTVDTTNNIACGTFYGLSWFGISIPGDLEGSVPILINDLVTFVPLGNTFSATGDTTGCGAGFVGKFSFDARLTNISSSSLSDIMVKVAELTNGNLLQNADGGAGGVDSMLTIGELSPGESVDVHFIICLNEFAPFTFFVDVFGIVE